jgi:hypothetical protein
MAQARTVEGYQERPSYSRPPESPLSASFVQQRAVIWRRGPMLASSGEHDRKPARDAESQVASLGVIMLAKTPLDSSRSRGVFYWLVWSTATSDCGNSVVVKILLAFSIAVWHTWPQSFVAL